MIPAKPRITFRSNATSSSSFGRRTLTATTRPSLSLARCTCATDADAIGTCEISANTSSGRLPSSARNVRSTSSHGKGPTLSCSVSSSAMRCGGNRSGRVDMICPTLTNVAPSARNSPTTVRANHACRRSRGAKSTKSTTQPTKNRTSANSTSEKIAKARSPNRTVLTGAPYRSPMSKPSIRGPYGPRSHSLADARSSGRPQRTIRLKVRRSWRRNQSPWRQRTRRRRRSRLQRSRPSGRSACRTAW